MKREFITTLLPDISKDVLDQVMAEHGKDIEVHKAQTTAANATIKDLQDAVKKFDGVDVEKLHGDLTTLQTKYDADTSKIKLDSALDMALIGSKAKNIKAVKALLDPGIIKLDGDKLLGIDEQLTKLKTEVSYLFEEQTDPSKVRVDSAMPHEQSKNTETTTLLGALQEKYNT